MSRRPRRTTSGAFGATTNSGPRVKGTTGLGVTVLLTANEVANAVDHHPQTCLIVVSGIELSADDPPIGAGGQIRRIDAWEPAKDDLKAVTYAYRVPDDG